jgi:hypothetical protein
MNIFVGNLSFEAQEIDVQRVFAAFGVVTSVAIVMEKKGKKSRGFGFVEMPDEQEAQAAIAQLNGQEILGRPINVLPALSKEPKSPASGPKNKYSNAVTDDRQGGAGSEYKKSSFSHEHSLKRTGKYKEGRRTISYIKQRQEAGITAPVSEKRYKSNPLRWRKKPRQQTSFARPQGQLKPWQRPQTESNPWKKPGSKSGAWKKPEGELRPWQKIPDGAKFGQRSPGGEVRFGQKSPGETKFGHRSPGNAAKPWIKGQSSQAKPWKKPEGGPGFWKKAASSTEPWKKTEGEPRPWKRATSQAKPWRKGSADRQQSRFKKPNRFSRLKK